MEVYYKINNQAHSITVKEDSFKNLENYQLNAILIKAFNWALKSIELNPNWVQECKKEQKKQFNSLIKSLKRIEEKEQSLLNKTKRTPQEAFYFYTIRDRKKEIKDILNLFY